MFVSFIYLMSSYKLSYAIKIEKEGLKIIFFVPCKICLVKLFLALFLSVLQCNKRNI